MNIGSIIIVILGFTPPHLLLSQEQGCSVFVSRNSTDPTEVSFQNYLEGFLEEKKIIKPVSASLNTGQINVSMIFAVDYNGTKITVELKDIILKTDSNSSDPNFFIDKYNANKTKTLIELKKLLINQNTIYIIDNAVLSDKTLNMYIQKLIKFKSLVNVHLTVTSELIYTDFIEIQYVGKEDCFLSSDYNNHQRHKRSTHSTKQDRKLHERLFINKMKPSEQRNKDIEFKSVVKNALSPRSISVSDECSNKRSGSTIEDVNDNYCVNSDNNDGGRRSAITNKPPDYLQRPLDLSIVEDPASCDGRNGRRSGKSYYPQQNTQQAMVVEKPNSQRGIFDKIKKYIFSLARKFVKYLYNKIKNIILKFIGLQESGKNFQRDVFDLEQFSPENLRNRALPSILKYLKETGNKVALLLIDDVNKSNKVLNK